MADIAQVGFGVDTSGLERAERGLDSLEKKQKQLNESSATGSRKSEQAFQRLAARIDPVERAMQEYRRAQTQANRAVSDGVVSQERANQVLRRYESALEQAQREQRQLTEEQRRANSMLGRTQRAFGRVQNAVFSLRGALAGLGVGLAVRQIIREFSEFERRMVEVGKVADLQGRQLDQLGRRIQDIARTVPVSTNRLQSLAVAAGQLGVTGVDNLAAFTETLGRLELATDIAGEQGARSLARLLNITGRTEAEISNLGAAITALGNQFATTEQEIVRTSTFLAPATTQFDVSAESVLGLSAALRAMGQRAETSGSAVGAAMGSMATAVAEGGAELRTLAELANQSTAEFAAAFNEDATQALLNFAEGLNQLPAAQQISVLEDLGLAGRETSRVINALASDVEAARQAVQVANDEWDANTALLRESLRASETFSGQMQLVANAVDEAAVEIGRELAPALLDATGQFRDFIIEARDAGEIAAVARDVGSAFQFLADNMALVTAAGTTLLGLNIGSKFGPVGAIIGTFAGALGGLVLALDETTKAERLYNEVLRETAKAMNDGKPSEVEAIKRRIDHARTALAAAEAEAQLEAVLSRTAGSMGDPSDESVARVEDLRQRLDAMGQQLLILQGALGPLGSLNSTLEETQEETEELGENENKLDKEVRDVIASLNLQEQELRALIAAQGQGESATRRVEAAMAALDAVQQSGIDTNVSLNDIIEQGAAAFDGEAETIAAAALEVERLNNRLGDNQEAQQQAAQAAEKAAQEVERVVEHSTDRLVDIGADAIQSIFDPDSTRDFWDSILDFARRTFAQIASEAVIRPIIQPIVAGTVGQLPQLFGLSGNAAAAAQGGAGFGGGGSGGIMDLLSVGSSLSDMGGGPSLLGGLSSALNSFGGSLGFATGSLSSPGITTGAPTAAEFLSSNTGIMGSTTFGQFLGGVGMGFTAGTLANSLVGGNQTGGMVGSGIGAAIGTAILPGIGSILGGLGGGLLGGLFGPGESVGPLGGGLIGTSDGRARVAGTFADNGGDPSGGRSIAAQTVEALNRIAEVTGAEIAPGRDVSIGVRERGGIFVNGEFVGDRPDVAARTVIQQFAESGAFEGVSENVATALSNIRNFSDSFENISESIEFAVNLDKIADGLADAGDELERIENAALGAARQQGEAIFEFIDRAERVGLRAEGMEALESVIDNLLTVPDQEEITQAERALAELRGQFEGLGEVLEDLGLDASRAEAAFERSREQLRQGFEQGIEQQILQITDPVQAALNEFDRAAERRLREAEALGADLVEVERLNQLERQRVIERAMQQSSGGLSRFLEELTFGDLSGASPQASLTGLRATFQATAAQAQAGDFAARGRIEELGRGLLEQSRGFFASGAGFQSDLDLVRGVVSDLVPANGNSAVVEAVNSGNVENVRLLSDLIDEVAQSKEIQREQADEIRRLSRALEEMVAA